METQRVIITGIVRSGVVVPEGDFKLPDGIRVEILMPEISPELQAEFDAWEAASDEDFFAFEAMLAGGESNNA